MTWFVRATRAVPVLVVGAAAGLAAGAMRSQTAPVPSLLQGSLAPAPVGATTALVPVLAVLWGWAGIPWASWAASGRRTSWLLLVLGAGAVASYAACSWFGGGVGGLLESLRNACGLAGLGLLGLRLRGEAGAVTAPLGYLLLAYLFGRAPGSREPSLWAWVLTDGGSGAALAAGAVLAAAGVAVLPQLPAALAVRG